MKKNKIYILGDSFCHSYTNNDEFWPNRLVKSLKNEYELVVNSFPSRDVQTIIDNWIKLLKHIDKNDILIVCIPFFIRLRVPLDKKNWMETKWDGGTLMDRFVTHHSWYQSDSQIIYVNGGPISKEKLNEKVTFFEAMFFDNESVHKNYNEVIESLDKITNCKKYIFSWDDMKYKTDVIEYKSDITNKIGWHTMHDVYVETNGLRGIYWDFHWSFEFQKTFAEYLFNKFKKII